MAVKGVIRTGEAFCLSCSTLVARAASTCSNCGSDLSREAKAFKCPKCQRAIALGEPLCPGCGLKFKVRAVKQRHEGTDDQFLVKLIEWGRSPEESEPAVAAQSDKKPIESEPVPSRSLGHLEQLVETINDLMRNRSEMLEKMQKRLESEKARLAELTEAGDQSSGSEEVEAQVISLAEEMADITMLQAHMESLSDEISALMNSPDLSSAVREKGLAAKALKMKLDAREKELAALKDREEQLVKREQMVERKIQGYAQKKKQLDTDEEALKEKLLRLEEEKASLERIKAAAESASSEPERELAKEAWQAEQKRVAARLASIGSNILKSTTGQEPTPTEVEALEADVDEAVKRLEEQIGKLISEKFKLQAKMGQAKEMDDDIKRLMNVLDQLLGQLPEEAIDKFAKSDDFAIYERVLDRLKE